MSIVIIEDDAAVGDALLMLFADSGRPVELMSTAEALIARGPPLPNSTVVVDMGLPGMSGADLIRWLKDTLLPLHIVAISGGCPCGLLSEQEALAGVPLLRKPPSGDWRRKILELPVEGNA